uniref:ATP synthase F0 subunit 8 n=1 Tax=Paraglypturus tonganus (nomen nudum) TaxID=1519029 RepID=A0A0U1V1I8_9EUCA|nr:ATP synthase F0 subunit 8 [Paraglypturus tonganus (nomen nudum)]AIG22706.1 ATP synthase F0 subunit 8 [Paraglypturus tonganus (nomen nudum)]
MPQMAPMMWMYLMVMFLFVFVVFFSFTYFVKVPLKVYVLKGTKSVLEKHWSW